jgi:fatty acid-binding protein DegV
MSVKIITDSSSDLTMDIAEKYNIEILSIFISDGTREYRDLIDINSEDIFRGQEKGIKYSTSQIPVFEYYNAFKKS